MSNDIPNIFPSILLPMITHFPRAHLINGQEVICYEPSDHSPESDRYPYILEIWILEFVHLQGHPMVNMKDVAVCESIQTRSWDYKHGYFCTTCLLQLETEEDSSRNYCNFAEEQNEIANRIDSRKAKYV